jgi:hypothetical protein
MAGLDPAIHVLLEPLQEGVDARVKPAHDDGVNVCALLSWRGAKQRRSLNGYVRP